MFFLECDGTKSNEDCLDHTIGPSRVHESDETKSTIKKGKDGKQDRGFQSMWDV